MFNIKKKPYTQKDMCIYVAPHLHTSCIVFVNEIANFQCFTHSYGIWQPFFINFGSLQRDFYGLYAYETIKSMKEMEVACKVDIHELLWQNVYRDPVGNHLRPACNTMEVTRFFPVSLMRLVP